MSKAGRIHAFEPSEYACRIGQENVILNGLTQSIEIINSLVAERPGEVCDFFWSYASAGASMLAGCSGHKHVIKKATLSLDAFSESQGLLPDLVKVDVEGAEVRVIQGMTRVRRDARPIVVVELHSWGGMTVVHSVKAILPLLRRVNYKMVYLRTRTGVKDPAVFENRGRCHVLLLPGGQPFPKQLATLDTSRL